MHKVVLLSFLMTFVIHVSAITNAEFYAFIEDRITETPYEVREDGGTVVDLSGDPNHDADLTPLLFLFMSDIDKDLLEDNIDLLRYRIRTTDSMFGDVSKGCQCQRDSCQCCAKKEFKVCVLHRCVKITVDVTNIPDLCFNVPVLGKLARLCLVIYNIDIGKRSACFKIRGEIDILGIKKAVEIELGCFAVPSTQSDNFVKFFQKKVQYKQEVNQKAADVGEMFEMNDLYKKWMQHNKIN